jgi:DeoR family ulaG and ulaABCDEF operon transcriptional repressor
MHVAERERVILQRIEQSGFVTFKALEKELRASPATIRRDLERLAGSGRIIRIHGGAKSANGTTAEQSPATGLSGVPFHINVTRHTAAKSAIGQAAAQLCSQGESVMIDGGSTTLHMCPHLESLQLQVLTNSLHIVSALLPQAKTRLLVPSGQVFREQNIILSITDDEPLPNLHAPKLFMGAASIGSSGLMQEDSLLVAAERKLIERCEQLIVLVDSSKFDGHSGHIVCKLDEIDILITDAAIRPQHRDMLEAAGIRVVIA